MQPLPPTYVQTIFRPLLAELVSMLRGLRPDDWERPTVAGRWRVRDVATHLLDGDLRRIAASRDDHAIPVEAPIASDRDLACFINGLNASGVAYGSRLSPRLLVDLLEITGRWVAELVESLPPQGAARFAVSWAGESASENWMDIGREYTERWHHQAQIRDAVGLPMLLTPEWMKPLLELSVRALPCAYSTIAAPAGTAVTLVVDGETQGQWSVIRGEDRWTVVRGAPARSAVVVRISTDAAWRLFYNALPADDMHARVTIEGDARLAAPLLRARSVIL